MKAFSLTSLRVAALLAGATCSLASCSNNDETAAPVADSPYIVGGTSSSGAVYLLQSKALNTGTTSIQGQGLEAQASTYWVYVGSKYLYSFYYKQGDPGTGQSFALDADGKLAARSNIQLPSRFTTVGTFGDYAMTAVTGTTTAGVPAITVNFINAVTQAVESKTITVPNMTGSGEVPTIAGIVGVGDKFYAGLAFTKADGSATAYPDSAYVAEFDKSLNYKVYRDGRISAPTARNRSQYYSGLAKDADDNVYAFSSGYYSQNNPSGVIRILKGAAKFDPNYYCNLAAAAGGSPVFKVWPIAGDNFLLQMYTTATLTGNDARKLAIFKASTKQFTWVTGLPALANISSFGNTVLTENGQVVAPVMTTNEQPFLYSIDPATGVATKGLEVQAAAVSSVGKLALP